MKKSLLLTLSIVGGIATILLSVLIGVLIGNADLEGNYTEELKEIKANITAAEERLKDEESKLLSIQEEVNAAGERLTSENEKLENTRTKVAEVKQLIDQKDTLTTEIESLKNEQEKSKKDLSKLDEEIKAKQGEVSELNDTIKAKKVELDKLEKTIVSKGEEPIQLTAGQYIVGPDVPEGRYQVTNIGKGTNFFVYDAGGMATVNTILGDSIVGTGDYVFFTYEGNMIETLGPVKLIPVK
ncbi:hypothetical protein ABFG93_13745 [Pseudalkalibacillus hwajinpoensis]|uniref:hypothetical protein n=1 Tax=Guptibacillus hwajinpoensis TaxID=208199 RepID=UPI00325A51CF